MRAYTVATLAREWDCSEGVIRKAIAEGEIGCFRLGTLIRIPVEEARRFECQNLGSRFSDCEADTPLSGGKAPSGNDLASTRPIAPQRKRKLGIGGGARQTPPERLAG